MKHSLTPDVSFNRALPGAFAAPEVLLSLSREEKAALSDHESVISSGLNAFFEVGHALNEIKLKRLYRQDFATFEEYCRKRWDMGRIYAYRLVNAASVRSGLLPIGNKGPVPENESQVRALTSLNPAQAKIVWEKAVAASPEGRVTAKIVNRIVRELGGKKPDTNENIEYWQITVEKLLRDALIAVKAGDKLELIGKMELINCHLSSDVRP